MEAGAIEVEENAETPTLKVISFSGSELPSNYQGVVIARWLNSLKKHSEIFKRAEKDSYYKAYEPYIKVILSRPNVKVRLAVLEEDHDVVFGWSASEPKILHYVHVQPPYNGHGISYDLIPKDIEIISHVTKHWDKCFTDRNNRFSKVKFNPFIY